MESPRSRAKESICIFALLLLSGCASTAPNFHGSWKPVNSYAATPKQIPLARAYIFYATPLDGTLKTMLTRWAKDTGIKLDYNIDVDYTLTKQAGQINSSSIQLAAAELNKIYGPQGVSIAVSDWLITVQVASKTSANQASSKPTR